MLKEGVGADGAAAGACVQVFGVSLFDRMECELKKTEKKEKNNSTYKVSSLRFDLSPKGSGAAVPVRGDVVGSLPKTPTENSTVSAEPIGANVSNVPKSEFPIRDLTTSRAKEV